jgi:hypothetical protein
MKPTEEEIAIRTNKLQEDCHRTIEELYKLSDHMLLYQDATNVWIFKKLAELELKIERIGNQ